MKGEVRRILVPPPPIENTEPGEPPRSELIIEGPATGNHPGEFHLDAKGRIIRSYRSDDSDADPLIA